MGTPDNPDGSSNLTYIFDAANKSAQLMKPGTIFIQKSTVPVGTGERVTDIISQIQPEFSYVSNPEFLREGSALVDSLYFDRIVVGGSDQRANQRVINVYKTVEKLRDNIAKLADLTPGHATGEYFELNLTGAELVKVTSNAFLALKISFANNIAKLADKTNADITEIMNAVGADKRIGRAFLNAGRGYGGGCFPKDVSGLIASAEDYGVDMPIMTAATDINDSMEGYIVNKALDLLKSYENKNIAVLGLAFKPGTSDVRKSPGIKMANILSKNGAIVKVFDPQANNQAKPDLRKGILIADSIENAVQEADAVFVATDWPEFVNFDLYEIKSLMRGDVLVDAMNAFDISEVEKSGLQYIGVGRGPVK